jgi:hypothetical protein
LIALSKPVVGSVEGTEVGMLGIRGFEDFSK